MRKIRTLYLSLLLTLCFNQLSFATEKECSEKLSRSFFEFNQAFDKGALLPTAKIYNKLPSGLKRASGNFLNNLTRLLNVPANLLQGNVSAAADNLGGFAINLTLGLGGIGDPATELGAVNTKEDFGQVLGFWGVENGCYFVLPILGPTTLRDTAGMVGDRLIDPFARYTLDGQNVPKTNYTGDPADYYGIKISGAVDFRAKNIVNFDNLEKNSLDLYSSIKSLYIQDRENKIQNKDSSNDDEWENFAK